MLTVLGIIFILVGLFFICTLSIPLIFSFDPTVIIGFIIGLVMLISGVWMLLKSSRPQTKSQPAGQPAASQQISQQPQQVKMQAPVQKASRSQTSLFDEDTRWTYGCFAVVIVIIIVGIIIESTVRYFNIRSNYDKGHEAYQQKDCAAAISYFDQAISWERFLDIGGYAARARQEKAECLLPVAIDKQQAGDFSAALAAYAESINLSGDASNSTVVESARNGIKALFEQAEPSSLATQESCDKIDTLVENDLIPQRDTNLPLFYLACGQVYEDDENYTMAVHIYEGFLSNYPKHQLASDAEAGLMRSKAVQARAVIAEAKAAGAGNLPAPGRSGSASSGSTVVVIQNDSTYQLQIVFGGPEGRFEELTACSSCETYPRGGGPNAFRPCRREAAIGRYTLKPGQYDILIKATKGNEAVSYVGSWNLSGGTEYNECFFFEVAPVP